MIRRAMTRRRWCLGGAALALTVPLAGCVTVHGERAKIPSLRPAEAAQVLAHFASVNNAAAKAYDEQLIGSIEAGPLGEIDRAGVRARHANNPKGNPSFKPLVLSDARFLIPEQRGWPKFFVADTATNRGDSRWLLVFRRGAAGQPWKADFLAMAQPGQLPDFAVDKDGHAAAVPLAGTELLVQPGQLSAEYIAYLRDGKGSVFAPGAATTELIDSRKDHMKTADSVTQYADQPADGDDFTPVALRTKDGGAVVFFSTRHQARSTYREGYRLTIDADTKALMAGDPKTSVTLARVGQETVTVPPAGGSAKVAFVSRLVGLVSAKGE
ncbi:MULTISPECIES: hypothetical protein [unclassified Streptomyces]|uniref:hypothetical protein n=1 Tax=unclassified Streptomyces TaxID=2593676 RepID=UPI002E2B38CC|nr:hypothetical protein [Streptomyces sp. NBC_00223]